MTTWNVLDSPRTSLVLVSVTTSPLSTRRSCGPDLSLGCGPEQVIIGLADEVGRGPIKEAFHGGIDLGIMEGSVLDENDVLGGLEDGPEAFFALLEGPAAWLRSVMSRACSATRITCPDSLRTGKALNSRVRPSRRLVFSVFWG